MTRDNKLTWIDNVEPDYLGIDWEPEGDHHPRNLMPTPYTEISRGEFEAKLHCSGYSIKGINYRQVYLPDEETIAPAHFYFFHDKAVAIVNYSIWDDKEQEKPGLIIWDGSLWHRMRYFTIGCQHPKMTTGRVAMHNRVDECPDCGFRASYDTSG